MPNKNPDQFQNLSTIKRLVPGIDNVPDQATFKTTEQRLGMPDNEPPLASLPTREERTADMIKKTNKRRENEAKIKLELQKEIRESFNKK